MERIARVAGDRLVLLVPVEGGEVEHHVAGQILVREPEPGATRSSIESGAPAAVCTLNGIPGCSTPAAWPFVTGAVDSSARMSSAGTA
jgi:hypothetical protein